MSIFNETGRKSRAWWLYMVKRAGNSPGINPIRKAARIDWASANDAIKDLAAGGYLEIGGNVHKHYNLTSMGHRYINEHKLELEEFRPESAIATEVTHAVPQFPEQVSRVDINSAPPIVFTKKPAKQPNMPSAPPPSAVEPVKPGLPAPSQGIIVTPKPKSFKAEFRRVLVDILLEKYTDQVTAADVMQRLEAERE